MKTKLLIIVLTLLACISLFGYFQVSTKNNKHLDISQHRLSAVDTKLNLEANRSANGYSNKVNIESSNDEFQSIEINAVNTSACAYIAEVKPIYSPSNEPYAFTQQRMHCVDELLSKLLSADIFSSAELVILEIHLADIAKKILTDLSLLASIKELLLNTSQSEYQAIIAKLLVFFPEDIQTDWAQDLLSSPALDIRLAGISILENILSNGSNSGLALFKSSLENASTPAEKTQLLKSSTLIDPTVIDEQFENTLYHELNENINSEAAIYAYESLLQTALFKTEQALYNNDQTMSELSNELETLLEKGLSSRIEVHSRLALEMLNAVYIDTLSLSSLNQQYIEQVAANESFSADLRERAHTTLQQYSRAYY